MAGTVIADAVQAASTSQLVIKNGVALTPPTINDVNGTQIGTFCRAWVNFNGSGTVAIRGSFNVSSITDNGAGLYTVNFTNAMPDVNYSTNVSGRLNAVITLTTPNYTSATASAVGIECYAGNGAPIDPTFICVSVFR